jgi:hypothetical protein
MSTEISCQLSLNKIVLDSIGGAMRKVLEICALQITEHFDELNNTDADERYEAIIKIFGLTEEDTVKILKPTKKTTDAKNDPKAKAEKKIPVPFWIYIDKTTKKSISTVDPALCQGLKAGLYSQCERKPKKDCIYCTTCQKDAEKNGGMPKRGNIELRTDQFADSKFEYTPPDGKPKKIYPLDWAIKNKFTEGDFDEMLSEKMNLTEKGLELIKKVPVKKVRAKKEKLTEDMTVTKGKTNKNKISQEQEEEEEVNDDDETSSQYSEATQHNDDDDVEFPPDEEEEIVEEVIVEVPKVEVKVEVPKVEVKPKVDPKVFDDAMSSKVKASQHKQEKPKSSLKIVNDEDEEPKNPVIQADLKIYKTVTLGEGNEKKRYAIVRDVAITEPFDIYDVFDYTPKPVSFKISKFPVGKYDPDAGELILN